MTSASGWLLVNDVSLYVDDGVRLIETATQTEVVSGLWSRYTGILQLQQTRQGQQPCWHITLQKRPWNVHKTFYVRWNLGIDAVSSKRRMWRIFFE